MHGRVINGSSRIPKGMGAKVIDDQFFCMKSKLLKIYECT